MSVNYQVSGNLKPGRSREYGKYLRRDIPGLHGLRGIRCGSPWKSSYLFYKCQVPSIRCQVNLVLPKVFMSIIREMAGNLSE